ncbi:hypothetical protein [Jeotgalibacillus proteolyticus]|uniref:hypothetical protein n=1 Tax=Jeotgalibacillus proteolyticus TaxID=2082395 RepID=UPI00143115D6|nr:hypothetical protein [Jeotgalibacillus proteolyticus]
MTKVVHILSAVTILIMLLLLFNKITPSVFILIFVPASLAILTAGVLEFKKAMTQS